MLNSILYVVFALSCISLILLILLQHGKGADAGAAFGSGASGTVFGAAGSSNFLSKATKWLAVLFFGLAMAMMFFQGKLDSRDSSVLSVAENAVELAVPQSEDGTQIIEDSSTVVPQAEENSEEAMLLESSSEQDGAVEIEENTVPAMAESTNEQTDALEVETTEEIEATDTADSQNE